MKGNHPQAHHTSALISQDRHHPTPPKSQTIPVWTVRIVLGLGFTALTAALAWLTRQPHEADSDSKSEATLHRTLDQLEARS